VFSMSGMWQWLQIHRLTRALFGSVAFLAAVLPALPYVSDYLWPESYTVYILHQGVDDGGASVWSSFDEGVGDYLRSKQVVLGGAEARVGSYKLRFQRLTWHSDEELVANLHHVLGDRQTLALIAATNSQDSEVILGALDPDDPPAVVLAAATKNDLLRPPRADEQQEGVRGVFRLVPTNRGQAEKLAAVIRAPDGAVSGERVRVAVLRMEGQNAAFSRDMAQQLRVELEKKVPRLRPADVLVDAAVDPTLTLPRELIELGPDYIVFIGSQASAAPFVLQAAAIEASVVRGEAGERIRFLFTDAGMFGTFAAFESLIERIGGTLPFKSASAADMSYQTLGYDAVRLIYDVVDDFGPQRRLERSTLVSALRGRSFDGEAQSYRFDGGENVAAQFHLWVHDGGWVHDPSRCLCAAESR
jgi:hypothetical protein